MSRSFEDALQHVLRLEGGFVNNPHDPGGETNLGVTRKVWTEWSGDPKADMRALTPAKVAPLYKARYWDVVRGDELPAPIGLAMFDFGVNAGPTRAARMLQGIVGAAKDGQIGPASIIAVRTFVAKSGLPELIRQFSNARRDYYRALPTFAHFGKGWLRRCDAVETECLRRCK